jgi:hypothetical protein
MRFPELEKESLGMARKRNQEPWTDCQVTAILFLSLPQAERKRR